ncbi:MAG: hypothetical protein H6734_20795 [Alphaproteobacteria bacterium]|nr:hypothetical protein [Alphaproteobacteria bacterium]
MDSTYDHFASVNTGSRGSWCDLGYGEVALLTAVTASAGTTEYHTRSLGSPSVFTDRGLGGYGGACGDFGNAGLLTALWGVPNAVSTLEDGIQSAAVALVGTPRQVLPADYDDDGVLDFVTLVEAITPVATLFVNDAVEPALRLRVRQVLPSGETRSDIGASVTTLDGNVGRQTLSGGQGHGTTAWDASGVAATVEVPPVGMLTATELDFDADGVPKDCDPCPLRHSDLTCVGDTGVGCEGDTDTDTDADTEPYGAPPPGLTCANGGAWPGLRWLGRR